MNTLTAAAHDRSPPSVICPLGSVPLGSVPLGSVPLGSAHLANVLVGVLLVAQILLPSAPCSGHDGHAEPYRGPRHTGGVLVFSGTGWYRHPETAAISGWLARLSDELEMQVDVTESAKDISQLLQRYKVLVLNNSNELEKLFSESDREVIEKWYAAGGGIVALHAALVHQQGWPWFGELAGCDFDSDSEFLEAKVVVDPAAKEHPAIKGHGDSFLYQADWTNHDRSVTGLPGFQVLLRVDESSYEPVRQLFVERGGKAMGKDHPIAWLHKNGGGRFFYTELGHDVRSLETDFGKQHIVEAIRWAAAADESPKHNVIFQDSFDRRELAAPWQIRLAQFTLRDGHLVGHEVPENGHGAVLRADLPFEDAIFEFDFKLTDGKSFNFVLNDKNCSTVHAGHICRVSFSGRQVRIADDKEGAMNNEIRARLLVLDDPSQREAILKGRYKQFPVELSSDDWHHASVSIIADHISVSIDGKEIGSLTSSGIGHPTKTDFGFTVVGNEILFDDVRVWSVQQP